MTIPPDLYANFLYEPVPWMQDAACRPHPTDWWFPKRGEPVQQAKTICYTCPVRLDCLNYALNIPGIQGIWGGMSGRERRDIRSKPSKPIRHGTPAGYQQHIRRGIEPCTECRKAHNETTKLRMAQHRQRQTRNHD